jgi:hypothetical protein
VLTSEQANDKADELLRALFAEKTPENRASYFADAADHRHTAAAFFEGLPPSLRYVDLELFPARIRRLPGGNLVPLFHVITSDGPERSTLCSLRSTREGEVKLDWELFSDSYSGALVAFQKVHQVEARWFTVGLRKNHGFDELPAVRETHVAFDVQCSFDGRDRTIALATKDSTSGRLISQDAVWGELYIARILLGWTPVNGEMRLTILDNTSVSEEIAQ